MSPGIYRQTKRQCPTEATRQRIVEATAALHAERGIAATTMKDIAARADAGAGTLYHHFPTYEDVVRAALGTDADESLVRLVLGLTDFAVHRAIVAGGASTEAAAAQVAEVLVPWLNTRRPGADAAETPHAVAAGGALGHHGAMTIKPVTLAATEQGEGPPVVILHGLFGSAQNWGTVARGLAGTHRVIAADLRSHGLSPHAEPMDYPAMAADVAALIEARAGGRAAVIGHSMGGKVAMWLALTRPALVERLVVVDVAPVSYRPTLQAYAAAMAALPLRAGMRRAEADAALAPAIADPGERAFLLQNLRFEGDGAPRWRLDLAAIETAIPAISAFPDPPGGARYPGPVLVVSGERSGYVRAEHHATILGLFPRAAFVVVPGAGHWVHAEAPEPFLRAVAPFLAMPG